MFKHKINKIVIFEGKTYTPLNGIIMLPKIDDRYNPVKEAKPEQDEKSLLVAKAVELGIDSKSKLERNSIDTLKKKIEEAN